MAQRPVPLLNSAGGLPGPVVVWHMIVLFAIICRVLYRNRLAYPAYFVSFWVDFAVISQLSHHGLVGGAQSGQFLGGQTAVITQRPGQSLAAEV